MSRVPDAWEDEWTTAADNPTPPLEPEVKKPSSKVTKAQRRAAQAEFNRQLWAEAEGPTQTNYFLESRNVVPLKTEYKPPPILLSRKGPVNQQHRPLPAVQPPAGALASLSLDPREEEESDEENAETKKLTLAERQAQAIRQREEKQKRYEDRRLELFGPQNTGNDTNTSGGGRSGGSTPSSLTPPHSRSVTPNRGSGRRGRGRTGSERGGSQHRSSREGGRELFDASYASKPGNVFLQRMENGSRMENEKPIENEAQPIRMPKGPDGSGGFGFASRGGKDKRCARHSESCFGTTNMKVDPEIQCLRNFAGPKS